jgi:glycosyltransferase involved in cell wall biosynthesis
VRNGIRWADEFTRCWKGQTFANFQLVVIDDGSLDGTADKLQSLWDGDPRLTLVCEPKAGRGSALNSAIAYARNDICLIADFDDISIPGRIEATRAHFDNKPDCDWLSYVAFTEDNHFRIGYPALLAIRDLGLRCLFGMPASFPTTAFRKSRFPVPFDTSMRAGVDCDWVRSNLAQDHTIRGELIQIPQVYYRVHENQLSAVYGREQTDARRLLIEDSYARILGSVGDGDRKWIFKLANNATVTAEEKRHTAQWISGLLKCNAECGAYDQESLLITMQDAFARLRVEPPKPTSTIAAAGPKPPVYPQPPRPKRSSILRYFMK